MRAKILPRLLYIKKSHRYEISINNNRKKLQNYSTQKNRSIKLVDTKNRSIIQKKRRKWIGYTNNLFCENRKKMINDIINNINNSNASHVISHVQSLVSMSEQAGSSTSSNGTSFEEWIRANGGDDEFVKLLLDNGFTSKLSLGNVDLESADAKSFIGLLSFGHKCLLRGLVKMASTVSGTCSPYDAGAYKAASLAMNGKSSSFKERIGKLFHYGGPKKEDASEDFLPTPLFSKKPIAKTGVKRKGGESTCKLGKGGPMKKKIKQVKLKVVGLPNTVIKRTPTGSICEDMTQHVWLNLGAPDTEVEQAITTAFGWRNRKIVFMYAQGKNLRVANLADVENSESWDLDTVRALMGSGSLYVAKGTLITAEETTESGISDEEIMLDNSKSRYNVSLIMLIIFKLLSYF